MDVLSTKESRPADYLLGDNGIDITGGIIGKEQKRGAMLSENVSEKDVVVFICVPFCVKEHMGDVFKAAHLDKQAREEYLDALKRELEASEDLFVDRRVRAIYVGGGIAAACDTDKLSRILLEFKRRVQLTHGMEFTIRFAPQTVGSPSLSSLNMCSFNRVSLEVLATRDKFLEKIDAPQRMADITAAIDYLGAFHAPNIDCELLYGIPGQTTTSLKNASIACTAGRSMAHITLRPYTGPGSEQIAEQERKDQYLAAYDCLSKNGFAQYSPECFARDGYQSEYVLSEYYEMDRIGFGLGAHSFIGNMSYRNTEVFEEYINGSGDFSHIVRNVTVWDTKNLAKRYLVSKLASNQGFDLEQFEERYPECASHYDTLWNRLCEDGLIASHDGKLTPTIEGLRIASQVRERIWNA